MKLNDIKSYCVHLPKRTDREENMVKELNSFTDNWEVFDAIKRFPGYIGTSESFQSIIRLAKEQGLSQVLIFEDDVKFTSEKSKDKFQKAIDSLPKDWDILLGGVYSIVDHNDITNDPYNEHIRKVGDFASLHCILVNESAFDLFLEHKPKSSKLTHLDRYLGYHSKEGDINVYLAYPMIAIQYNTFSDNVRGVVDYDKMLEKFELFR